MHTRQDKCLSVHIQSLTCVFQCNVFQATITIFELVQDIIRKTLLTKFHDDRTINVASIVLTSIFEFVQDIIGTNLLTKFHEDWTINVASRVLTRQMLTPHAARQTKADHKSLPSAHRAQMS
ncbi:hypothetical protein DPMN_159622 [Dreissena polymorpha]|uniref:Uncharacterized protein n=1 Tax=Dreissena polymorpha TaxID=45954 RepID=A0A9D4ELA4_DREPO|nr:hypothetical protein DPMN_159622 [Dreissena polymorpha]